MPALLIAEGAGAALATWRPTDGAPAFDEGQIQHAFAVWIASRMRPRSSSAAQAKPGSILAVLNAVRRLHVRAGLVMRKPEGMAALERAMNLTLVKSQGVQALAPARKQALARDHLLAIRLRCAGAPILRGVLIWEHPFWHVFWTALLTTWTGGMRLSDALSTQNTPFHLGRLARASLTFKEDGGVRYAELATPTTTANLLGMHWHHRPFVFSEDQHLAALNLHGQLVELERLGPSRPASARPRRPSPCPEAANSTAQSTAASSTPSQRTRSARRSDAPW